MTAQDVLSVPTRTRTVFWVSAVCLALALIAYAYINFIAPPAGDMWRHAITKPIRPIHDYVLEYFSGNPRIGELVLNFESNGDGVRAFIQTAILAYFLFAAAWLVVGPLRKNALYLPLVAVFILAMLIISVEVPGQLLFYAPRTANYIFGYALVLSFLTPYRLDLGGHRFRRPLLLIALMMPLGLLAGMSNEHTVPAHVAALSVLLVYALRRTGLRKTDFWKYSGLASLVIGYLLLFFAPGQDKRYGGVKYEGILAGFGTLLTSTRDVIEHFFIADILVIIVILALFWLFLQARRRPYDKETRSGLLLIGYLVATSLLIVMTIGLAPLKPERLYFAATVNLAVVAAFLVLDVVRRSKVARKTARYGATALTAVFFIACLAFYGDVHGQFLQRAKFVKAQKAEGKKRIALPAYEFEWWPADYFMRDEGVRRDPKFHRNRSVAKYFGVESVRLVR